MPLPDILWIGLDAVAPEQIWKWGGGAHVRRKTLEKLFAMLQFFGSTSTISRFCEHFRDGQYSSVSFLFAVLLSATHGASCTHAQPSVKVGGHLRPPVPSGVGATDWM